MLLLFLLLGHKLEEVVVVRQVVLLRLQQLLRLRRRSLQLQLP